MTKPTCQKELNKFSDIGTSISTPKLNNALDNAINTIAPLNQSTKYPIMTKTTKSIEKFDNTENIEHFDMNDLRNACDTSCSKINLMNILIVIVIILLIYLALNKK